MKKFNDFTFSTKPKKPSLTIAKHGLRWIQCGFIWMVLFSPNLSANIETLSDDHLEPNPEEINPNTLKSLSKLQSLKQLPPAELSPTPFVQELPNALQVRTLFVETHDLPIVDLQLTFHAGSSQDHSLAAGMSGIANIAARLMPEGTNQYSAKQLDAAFDALGAQYNVSAYRDMFIVRLRVLSEPSKLEPALNLLLHMIKHANFNTNGLNLMLSNTKVGQKQLQENPSRLMSIRFYRSVYGNHPYAEPTVGTQASIKKINPELLQKFRDSLLVAQNSNIAITGNLSAEQATRWANYIATRLPQGQAAAALPEPLAKQDFDIQFIPHQSSQAYITLGHLSIEQTAADRAALEVANRIFGGGSFNSILSKELRVKRGYTYSASSTLTTTAKPGIFSFSYSTQQDQLMESLQIAHQTYVQFLKIPLTKAQVEETKAGLLRAYPMYFSSNANINAQIASIGFYGLDRDHLNQYQHTLKKLSVQDVQNAIDKHLHADKMTVVIVAEQLNQDEVKNMLKQNLKSAAESAR